MSPDNPPKPDGHFLFGNSLQFQDDPLGNLTSWHDELGDIFEIDIPLRNLYVVASPEYIKRIIEDDADKFRIGQLREEGFKGFDPEAIVLTDGEQWKRLRNIMQPFFTPSHVSEYRKAVLRETDRLIDEWNEGERLNLYEEMSNLTIRVVSNCLMGHDLKGREKIIRETADALIELGDSRKMHSALPDWIPTPAMRSFRRAKQNLYDLIEELIEDKKRTQDDSSLMGHMVQAHEDGRLTYDELRENLLEFFIAGSDTSSAALTYTFFLLGQNPEERGKLESLLNEQFSLDDFDPTSVKDHDQFQFAVEEAMRLYPPGFATTRTANEDVRLNGYEFEEGDQFMLPQWVVHRDEQHFEDSLAYRPERWRNRDEWPRYAEFAFGGGNRYCIGSHFAMMEMPIVVARILQQVNYDLITEELDGLVPSITLRPEHPVEVTITEIRSIPSS